MTKKKAILHVLSPMLLPLALVEVIMAAAFSIYECPVPRPIVLLGVGVISAGMFSLCYFTERHKTLGGFLITGVLLASYIGLQYLIWGGYRVNYIMFQQWLLTAGNETTDSTLFLWALFFGGSVFFSVTIYYFSRVMYRMSFLTLISLLPCVLYAKVMTDIENVYLILLAIVNVGIYLVHRREMKKGGEGRGLVAIVISSGCFILLVFLICAVIPKEKDAKYYNRFEDAFLGGDTSTELNADFTDLGEYSGNADRFSNLGNRRLYSLNGDGATYLKRQNFDYYDFEKDRWYAEETISGSKMNILAWFLSKEKLGLENLQAVLRRAEEYSPGFAAKYGLEGLIQGNDIIDPYYSVRVTSLNFGAVYYLMPTRGVRLGVSGEEFNEVSVTTSGTFRRESGPHAKDYEYDVVYYGDFASRNLWIGMGGSNLTDTTEDEMLLELWVLLEDNEDEMSEVAGEWYQQHSDAMRYEELCRENTEQISNQIKQLARQLTQNCTYDWEKAYALQDYFHSNGFSYDLDYVARDTSPEYFLFRSKRGTCSDFASAYVLLARAAGLTVRYAEGYVPESSGKDNTYYVKDSGSHAYPEVYLQGYGWTIFEPTTAASDIYDDGSERSLFDALQGLDVDFGLVRVILYFAGFFAGLLMLVKWCLPMLAEIVFQIRAQFMTPNKSVKAVYKRLVKKTMHRQLAAADCMTPRQLQKALAEREIDISPMVESLEKGAYGNENLSEEQRKDAISVYRKACRRLHRRVKK